MKKNTNNQKSSNGKRIATDISKSGSTIIKQQSSASIEEIFKTYYNYLKSYQPRSHDSVKKNKKHHKFFFGLEEITQKDIVEYQKKRLNTKRKDSQTRKISKETVERELQHCHSAYTRAINAGLTDRNPFDRL